MYLLRQIARTSLIFTLLLLTTLLINQAALSLLAISTLVLPLVRPGQQISPYLYITKYLKFHSTSLLNNISTPSSYLSFCYGTVYAKPVYPGQTLVLYLSARDKYVHKVQYSVVSFVMGQTINNGSTIVATSSFMASAFK